jgi:hypothetical protein
MNIHEVNATQQNPLLENRVTLEQLRKLLSVDPENPCCERSVRCLMDRLDVPFVKVLAVRFYDLDAVRSAILASEVNRQPRRRGRPATRKAA